ncbi:MAG: metal ABC transporter solute-binding protein, Zn/Mn family [Tropicimonas sp.]|uniref:metal ABC transporter solute-binding protein, Zn/Mn family n=1 Tax=Tropicimonas sp. TaxID=2067044 RepID=UPI003A848826
MISRRLLLTSVTTFVLAASSALAADAPLKVVASFSILGDIVSEIGGERVEVSTLVGADGDAHVYQPTPNDARAMAGAAVIVTNGLGFEGWMDRLVAASGTQATIITASDGITPLAFDAEGHDDHEGHDHGHDHGAVDPHAWQDVVNVMIYVSNIERGLGAVDPDGAAAYAANAAAYVARLEALDGDIHATIAALPENRRTILTSHDAFGYFESAYGLHFEAPQGVSTDAEASAQDVAALITRIREEGIGAVFVENIADPRLLDRIAAETDARIGGTLYSDALSGPDGPAATYIDLMRHNLAQLTDAGQ